MTTISLVLSGIEAVLGLLLIVIILFQSGRSAGLGAVGGSGGDSYWGKNKSNSMEGSLAKYTKFGGALFMVIGLVIMFLNL